MGIVMSAVCAGLIHLYKSCAFWRVLEKGEAGRKASSAFGMLFIVPGVRLS